MFSGVAAFSVAGGEAAAEAGAVPRGVGTISGDGASLLDEFVGRAGSWNWQGGAATLLMRPAGSGQGRQQVGKYPYQTGAILRR